MDNEKIISSDDGMDFAKFINGIERETGKTVSYATVGDIPIDGTFKRSICVGFFDKSEQGNAS